MISTSLAASCLRIANICSCLRMVEAFSTACSSAKASSSVGDLDLRSWSFISRIGGFLESSGGLREKRNAGKGREESRRSGRGVSLGPDAVPGVEPETRMHPPAFQESDGKI